jgi:D-glycero-D-manno-heptose 1,7-bisphosphate phosphatase
MGKYIFLDRDGTLIHDVNYLQDKNDIVFFKNSIKTLKSLLDNDFRLVIITNQSGIGRGFFNLDTYYEVNNEFLNILNLNNIQIHKVLHCPHKPSDECECRKPKIKLFKDFNSNNFIDIKNSWMIGDKKSDIDFGKNCNLSTIFLNSSNLADTDHIDYDFEVKEIHEILNIILNYE